MGFGYPKELRDGLIAADPICSSSLARLNCGSTGRAATSTASTTTR
jgi:hypothetical protein